MTDLSARRENWVFNRGDNPEIEFTFTEEDTGDPIDFSGDAVVLTVNATKDGSAADLFQLSPTNALDATGVVKFRPTTAQMAALTPDTYFYDVEWTTAAGDVRTLVAGEWVIAPDVTN